MDLDYVMQSLRMMAPPVIGMVVAIVLVFFVPVLWAIVIGLLLLIAVKVTRIAENQQRD